LLATTTRLGVVEVQQRAGLINEIMNVKSWIVFNWRTIVTKQMTSNKKLGVAILQLAF